ncbi:O-antigen polymerase [Fusobacterium gastrosuis]|uniref:O-antigen polymerase n=1 Tax=Fusobacterium gastrosuis TaxID=1755100 RepID=UPI0029743864|nr:O-antigen ligase [Fusobacteriaceae bacterium]MDY5712911.1 O-antigen polymerase [Fusobacterium gastrosuis]
MIFILFIGILFLFILSFFLFKKNILNPSVVICSVFLVSLLFSILNINNWNLKFNLETVLIVLYSLIVFILGNTLVIVLKMKNINIFEETEIRKGSFYLHFLVMILLSLLIIPYFKGTYQLSIIGGNPGGYDKMLMYTRKAKLSFYNIGKFNTLSLYLARAVSYISIYIFSHVTIFKGFKFKNLYLLMPTIIYSIFLILTTGRNYFIYLTAYILVIYFTLFQRKYKFNKKLYKTIIVYGIVGLTLFIIIFLAAGFLTGKTQRRGVFEEISLYVGSSIPALNLYMENERIAPELFGQNTLFRIYNILRKLGYSIPQLYAPFEFVNLNERLTTNIYTGIRRYYQDFGFIGLTVMMYFLGAFYGIFFHIVCYAKKSRFKMILYATFCYPIFEFVIEERFFMTLFPTEMFYNMIFLGVVYYFYVYRISLKKYKSK